MLIVFNKSTVCQCWEKKWVILRRNKQKNAVINVCMLWNRNELRTKSGLGWNDYGRFKWKLRRIPKRDFQKSALLYVHLKREEVLHPNMSAKTTPGPGVNRVLDVNKPQDEHKKKQTCETTNKGKECRGSEEHDRYWGISSSAAQIYYRTSSAPVIMKVYLSSSGHAYKHVRVCGDLCVCALRNVKNLSL